MNGNKHIFFITGILLLVNIFPLFAFSQDDFPVPRQLEPNVEFWVRIFTLYSESQVVIHDSYHPEIVYEIVNLNEHFTPQTPIRVKWKLVNRVIDQYQDILAKLSRYDDIDISRLSDKERHVYFEWLDYDDPGKFKNARYAVRGQRGLKEDFRAGLIRSGKYMPEFIDIFKSHDVPVELICLPHIESSFQNRAYSKVGAAGLWQFIRSTGRLYLSINRYQDQRLDPFAASDAAARLLKHNYQILGSWPLAITAYNHGPNGMVRAIRRLGTKDIGVIAEKYKSRSFGFASRNFYAEFVAAVKVRAQYRKFFGDLQFEKPDRYTSFRLPEPATLQTICLKLNIPKSQIIKMNPHLLSRVVSSSIELPRDFDLRLPLLQHIDPYLLYAGGYDSYQDYLTKWLPTSDDQMLALDHHATTLASTQVRFVENLISGPREYVSSLVSLTSMATDENTFDSGVMVPAAPASGLVARKLQEPRVSKEQAKPSVQETLHTPQTQVVTANTFSFDSLLVYLNQAPYGPDAPDTLFNDNIDRMIDELLAKMDFSIKRSVYITVLPNETLGHYADWLQMSTHQLRSLNRIKYGRSIHIGQSIKLPFNRIDVETFKAKRLQYHMDLRQEFYAENTIVGTQLYKIKRGDNIWRLCRQKFNVPFWLVANYNLGILLNSIQPGDEIRVPIISPFAQNQANDFKG